MEKFLRSKLLNGVFKEVSLVRSNMMKAVKARGNKSTEVKFCDALVRANIKGWKAQEKLVGTPDVFFPNYKLAIFLDGCFWHSCPKCGHIPKTNFKYWKAKLANNVLRDSKKKIALENEGYTVIRFWEHELINDIDGCIELLKDKIEENLIEISTQSFMDEKLSDYLLS